MSRSGLGPGRDLEADRVVRGLVRGAGFAQDRILVRSPGLPEALADPGASVRTPPRLRKPVKGVRTDNSGSS